MSRWLQASLRWSAGAVFAVLCAGVAVYALGYLFRDVRPDSFGMRFAVSGLDVPAHFIGAGVALLLAPLQLWAALRRRVPTLHRISGWLYAGMVVIAGLGGLSMARHAYGGFASGSGFALLAVAWISTTAVGVRYAIAGDVARHRRWMWRSVALTASAVTLRLELALGGMLHWPFLTVYITAAWTCWTFNLAVCELLLRWPAIRARVFALRVPSAAGAS